MGNMVLDLCCVPADGVDWSKGRTSTAVYRVSVDDLSSAVYRHTSPSRHSLSLRVMRNVVEALDQYGSLSNHLAHFRQSLGSGSISGVDTAMVTP